jgi:alpha-L-rhamnosidase
LPGLHAAGRDDLAYGLLLQEEMPSWLYPVKRGATTIWERWDGWTPPTASHPGGFADSGMNSFNHYAFGAVGEFLFGYIGGIREIEPGYSRIRIAPVIQEGLTWAKCEYRSIRGPVACAWHREEGRLTLSVTIPPNANALVLIPCAAEAVVMESGKSLGTDEGVVVTRRDDLALHAEIGSGRYEFEVSV